MIANLITRTDAIVTQRQKGTYSGLVRELFATVEVTVKTATIARFLTGVTDTSTSPRQRQRLVAVPAIITFSTSSQSAKSTPAQRPRMRGPRIADLRNANSTQLSISKQINPIIDAKKGRRTRFLSTNFVEYPEIVAAFIAPSIAIATTQLSSPSTLRPSPKLQRH